MQFCGIIPLADDYGRLAQLVEHPLDVRAVMGSSPLASTIFFESTNFIVLSFFIMGSKPK